VLLHFRVAMLNVLKKDPWPRSHYDLIEQYYARYDERIATGEFQPFLYPWGTFGAAVVIAYLLIPHQNRPWLKSCRYVAFAWAIGFASYTMLYTRAKGMAPSFGVGLISAWSVIWIFAILICNDAQTDFQRIERLEGAFGSPNDSAIKESHNETPSEEKAKEIQNNMTTGHAGPSARHGSFAWQPYPLSPFIERLDWVLDIFCNFRGAGWNWRTSALPPPPKAIQEQLYRNSGAVVPKTSNRIHSGQVQLYSTRKELLTANIQTCITGYIMLDALKTVLMYDPYFWGVIDSNSHPPPSYYPTSPVLIHVTRLALSMFAVKTALQTIFSLGPIFFCAILGPRLLGARAECWMYPETWAPYTVVLDKGLAGWWGSWWHQTFRFAFQEPGRKVVEGLGWEKRSVKAKAVQLGIAFGLSGIVHACGSWTCWGDGTKPIRGPMVFFMLQAVGIFVEGVLGQVLKKAGVAGRVPPWLMRVWTFVYVHVWFYYTAHLLCDDFAGGGVWLFEPVPVSLFRGLGFGADKRDGWWCWTGVERVLRWHRGDSWWTTGIAF
jgi:hypothetical protein